MHRSTTDRRDSCFLAPSLRRQGSIRSSASSAMPDRSPHPLRQRRQIVLCKSEEESGLVISQASPIFQSSVEACEKHVKNFRMEDWQ